MDVATTDAHAAVANVAAVCSSRRKHLGLDPNAATIRHAIHGNARIAKRVHASWTSTSNSKERMIVITN